MNSNEEKSTNIDTLDESIRKESVPQTDASLEVERLFNLHSEFEKTKKYLKNIGNLYVNNLFSFLGYHFKGEVQHPNILHISAQAWLLGVIGELKKEEGITKVNYYNLLKGIKHSFVEENNFIENMRLLTGIYEVDESSLNDNRIFKMFLVNIQETKNQIFMEDIDGAHFTKSDFDETLIRTLRISFNFTLNEFNSSEEDKKSLDFINLFLELQAKSKPLNFPFKSYFDYYSEKKNINEEALNEPEERKLFLNLECFYDFCQNSLEDLLKEIEFFNINAGSVIFKIMDLVSVKNIKRMYIKYFDYLLHAVQFGVKNLRLESVTEFIKTATNGLKPSVEKVVTLVSAKYSCTKDWIESSVSQYKDLYTPVLNNMRQYYSVILEMTNKYTEVTLDLLKEKIIRPARHLALKVTDSSVHFAVNTYALGEKKAKALVVCVQRMVEAAFSEVKGKVKALRSLIDINKEKAAGFISISISQKLFLLDPTRANQLVKSLISLISNFNPTDSALKVATFTKDKVDDAKLYLVSQYKRFLSCAEGCTLTGKKSD